MTKLDSSKADSGASKLSALPKAPPPTTSGGGDFSSSSEGEDSTGKSKGDYLESLTDFLKNEPFMAKS